MDKKVVFSGIQSSGALTLGNYLGAIVNWRKMQDEYSCIYSIVDQHAITVRNEPALLRARTLEMMAALLAAGIDENKSLLFFQSHVSAHASLAWVLNCYTQFGELMRMTQFKDKSAKNKENVNAGLFTYPVLMAADILLYQAQAVPVGDDQKQHLELARNIAIRFNGIYGDVFTIPEPFIPELGARVMSLSDPLKKMSKSDENINSYISLADDTDTIIRKFKKAVTDSDACVKYAEGKDGVNNLMSIYSSITGKSFDETEQEFTGKGYGDFKLAVGECVESELAPIRDKFKYLLKNKDYLQEVYTKSAQNAAYIANKTLRKVYKKIGFIV